MPSPDRSLDPRAVELFQEFRAGAGATSGERFEALCRSNPALERDLRELQRAFELVSRLGSAAGSSAPLAKQLGQRLGSETLPLLSLEGEPKRDAAESSRLFEKLRATGSRGMRYRLLGEIARGGMGVVFRIWDDELRRTLAMKVVLGQGGDREGETPVVEPKVLGRFLEEAQITGQLDHPGIVPVHELGLGADGRVYFTMRLVKGVDLRTVFEQARRSIEGWNQVRAVGVVLKVCDAMSYAHSKGVLHRDLKPANVMVGKFGEVYVMDWGLARVIGREDPHDLRIRAEPSAHSGVLTDRELGTDPDSPLLTMDGDVVGTPSFMAPEQAKGQLELLGPHSDVYSVGALLYQLLAGEMPYVPEGARLSQQTVLLRLIEGPPAPLSELAPHAPAELVAICEKAMAREIADRYPSMPALAADLRAFTEGRVVRAFEQGRWAETRKWVRRNRPVAASLAAAMLAIAAGAVGFAVQSAKATRNERHALDGERSANARADAVWAIQELREFWSSDDELDYAREQPRPAHVWWLERAHELVDGRPADAERDLRRKPGLVDHQRLLAEVRASVPDPTRRIAPHVRTAGVQAAGREAPVDVALDSVQRWWIEQLTQLEQDLTRLQERTALVERSVATSEAVSLWDAAIEAIAVSPRYGGLMLTPQLELLPIGADPATGLWEFAHLPTGNVPQRDATGAIQVTSDMGLVFVLLPGGRVPVEDGTTAGPLEEVDLDPFFLSKYEMTQAQCARAHWEWPGQRSAEDGLLAADGFSWDEATAMLEHMGLWLALPTEAQWEYGCRAGTTTAWWTGARPDTLLGAANLAFEPGAKPKGSIQSAPSARANAFGLHDVHGNLMEWCRDSFESTASPRPGDGLRNNPRADRRVCKGGFFDSSPSDARSSFRAGGPPDQRSLGLGLRPARGVHTNAPGEKLAGADLPAAGSPRLARCSPPEDTELPAGSPVTVALFFDRDIDSARIAGREARILQGDSARLELIAPDQREPWNLEFEAVARNGKPVHGTLTYSVRTRSGQPALKVAVPAAGTRLEAGSRQTIALAFDRDLGTARIADGDAASIDGQLAQATCRVPSSAGEWLVPYEVSDRSGNRSSGHVSFAVDVPKETVAPAPVPSTEALVGAPPPLVGTPPPSRAPPASIHVDNLPPMFVRDDRLSLHGSVSDPLAKAVLEVDVNGTRTPLELHDGNFELEAQLPLNGRSNIRLLRGDARVEFEVIQDSIPPMIEVLAPKETPVHTNATEVLVRVEDPHLSSVTLDGQPMEAVGGGLWSSRRALLVREGANDLELVADDMAGNRSMRRIVVIRDSVAPRLAEAVPAIGSSLAENEDVRFEFTFDEPLAELSVGDRRFEVNGRRATGQLRVPAGSGSWVVNLRARDLAGNELLYPVQWLRGGLAALQVATSFPGFEPVGQDVTTGGYPRTLRHLASGIVVEALEDGGSKPQLYFTRNLVTVREFSGKGGDEPQVSVSAESLVQEWCRTGRGRGLALPSESEWLSISKFGHLAQPEPAGMCGELLRGSDTSTYWPTRGPTGKPGSILRVSTLSLLGFRVVFLVP